jgi:heptosyltransferase III
VRGIPHALKGGGVEHGLLVLRPGALGDTLLALPALRALRRAVGPLTLAAHAGAARLLAGLGEVDAGMAFDDLALRWVFGAPTEAHRRVVAWMNADGAPGLHGALLVAPSRPPGDSQQHVADYLLQSLAPLGIELAFDSRPLGVVAVRADEILIHPGSGSAAKNWPAARLAETIRKLESPVRLIVGEADAGAARGVEDALGSPLPRLEHPSLELLAQRLAGCLAYLGNDSGVSHLAGLCGTRSVVMFGSTSADVWRPVGPHVQVQPFDATPAQVAQALS